MTRRRNCPHEKPETSRTQKARPSWFDSKMTQIEPPHSRHGSQRVRNGPKTKSLHELPGESSKLSMSCMDGRNVKLNGSSWFSETGFLAGEGRRAASIIPPCFSVCRWQSPRFLTLLRDFKCDRNGSKRSLIP